MTYGIKSFFAGLYPWVVTVFFGAVLLDTVYADLVPQATPAFSEVSDFLLLLGGVTFLAAVGAIAFAWKARAARNTFIASLIVLSFEFLVPVVFSALVQDAQGSGLGATIRILINGAASLLAFIGLHRYYRSGE